jgi:hypothetical protein
MTGVTAVAALLAHQGGWDEILLVAAPILLIIGALWVVKRRVDRMGAPSTATPAGEPRITPDPGSAPSPRPPSD